MTSDAICTQCSRRQQPQLLLVFRRELGGLSPWAKFLRLRVEIDEALLGEIRRRREDPDIGSRSDILSMLVQPATRMAPGWGP